jgi:hypothetical protein
MAMRVAMIMPIGVIMRVIVVVMMMMRHFSS